MQKFLWVLTFLLVYLSLSHAVIEKDHKTRLCKPICKAEALTRILKRHCHAYQTCFSLLSNTELFIHVLQLLTLLLMICVWFQQKRQNSRRQVCHFSAPRECVYEVKKKKKSTVSPDVNTRHSTVTRLIFHFNTAYQKSVRKKTCFCIILLVQQEAAFTSYLHLATVPYKSWTGQG